MRTGIYIGNSVSNIVIQNWTPQIPTGLTATVIFDNQIDLSWNNVDTSGDGVKIKRRVSGVGSYSVIATLTLGVSTYADSGVFIINAYDYQVVSYKGSIESNPDEVTTTATEWFLLPGTPSANFKAVYDPLNAASLAASYVNKAQPGTNDAQLGTAPSLDGGWVFAGAQYLKTGLVPVNNQQWSLYIKYSDYVSGTNTVIGTYEGGGQSFSISVDQSQNKVTLRNGGENFYSPHLHSGVVGFNGDDIYINGVWSPSVGPIAGNFVYDIYIGVLHYSSLLQYFTGKIQSVIIWDTPINYQLIPLFTHLMNHDYTSYLAAKLRLKGYVDNQFGALICWNMPSFMNLEYATPDQNVNVFAPTGLDVDEWLDACVDAGMTYAILTVKHHDGFCLWPTAYAAPAHDPYSIAETDWYLNNGEPDVVELFCDGCRSRGLKVGIYFSVWDATYEVRTGTNIVTGTANYIAMIQTQLTELLTNYGDIYCMWFDAWSWSSEMQNKLTFPAMKAFINAIQALTIVKDNIHVHPNIMTEIEGHEHAISGDIPLGNTFYAELVQTIRADDTTWFYHSDNGQTASDFFSKADINTKRALMNGRNAAYLLGITPDTTGHLPTAQKSILESLQT